MAQKKILIVAPHPFFEERGTPIAVRLLAETLCEAGHAVDLLTYHVGSPVAVPGLRVIRIPAVPGIRDVPIGFSAQKLVCDFLLSLKLFRMAIRNRYDVIHAVEESVFPALLVRPFSGARVVYDMDSSLPDQLTEKHALFRPIARLLYGLERAAIRRSDHIVAVCDDLAERALAVDGAKPVTVLRDVPLDSPAGTPPAEDLRAALGIDGPFALYIGNLERYQGIDLLLEGFARASSTMPLVVIGGTDEDIARYRRAARQHGVDARFLGRRPVAQLPDYLRQATILCSPRIAGTNTPMKVFSYLAAGKAIIATNIASHTQVMDAESAMLVEPDADSFARGLERLVSDPDLGQRLGESARRLAASRYSLATFKRTLASAYRRIGSASA